MLLNHKKRAVQEAWLHRCEAEAEFMNSKYACRVECRRYFTRPSALVWPFAAGVLLVGIKRAAPEAIKTTGLLLSAARLVGKVAPLARKFSR